MSPYRSRPGKDLRRGISDVGRSFVTLRCKPTEFRARNDMSSICIIGQGNVATHLCVAFSCTDNEVIQVNSRTLEDLPTDADAYIISVSDSAIAEVASRLPQGLRGVVAHTSGSTPADVLQPYSGRYGVLYPLMTFSRDADIDYSAIPFFTEGSDEPAAEVLSSLARELSEHVYPMDSAQRKKMHIASVFACNFANHLWDIAYGLLKEEGVPFRHMMPLIEATFRKLQYITPRRGQTGPAVRGDRRVVESHIQALADRPELAEIYRMLSESIASAATHPEDSKETDSE